MSHQKACAKRQGQGLSESALGDTTVLAEVGKSDGSTKAPPDNVKALVTEESKEASA